MATTWINADTRRRATPCRSCGKPIEFAKNARSGRVMPFDAPIVALRTKHDEAGQLLEEVDLATSHFVTCPDAARFRKAR